VFVYAASADGAWWVLRLNDFPDHPLFTLFVSGVCIGDIEDIPARAPAWNLEVESRPALATGQRNQVLQFMRGLGPYGTEVGQPCESDWCTCSLLTDEYILDT
jgi:hypothetical protein